ncbi:MAG: hypothetical protein NC548_05575 [Lachnospiraceae bacterium]|nr:hypothetical protein [Lachnospiraceae bacterium]
MGKNRNRGRGSEPPKTNYGIKDPDLESMEGIRTDEDPEDGETLIVDGDVSKTPSNLLFNTGGFAPVSVTYRIPISELKAQMLRILQVAIDDVIRVGCNYSPETGEILFYAQFRDGSKHFNDQSMRETMISDKSPRYYSPELRRFCANYGMKPKEDCARDKNGNPIGKYAALAKKQSNKINIQNLVVPMTENGNFARSYAVLISWTTLIKVMFDYDDRSFQQKYNAKPGRSSLDAHFSFGKSGGNPFGKLEYLEVIKSANTIRNRGLSPKLGFNGIDA